MRILVCTDGSTYAADALRFGTLIARRARGPITLLGVVEAPDQERRVRRAIERTSKALCEELPDIETKLRYGHAAEEILKETEESEYDLVIIGSRGRRGITRFLLGSTAARLSHYCQTSVLIVKGKTKELTHMLVCTGGAEAGEKDTRFAGSIAATTGATVTVLHVMSQLPLTHQAQMCDLENSTELLLASGSPEGVHLQKDLQILEEMGVKAEAKVRHGLVVEEILCEADEGDYDLIVVGAHVVSGLMRFIVSDVTQSIVLNSQRPVLVVRWSVDPPA
jgi:nucleotide-binding universal stress UspA family protein